MVSVHARVQIYGNQQLNRYAGKRPKLLEKKGGEGVVVLYIACGTVRGPIYNCDSST